MPAHLQSLQEDLFYGNLIQPYVNSPTFVERYWLVNLIETALADRDCRFVLVTAEPGAGKTVLQSWLASQHPTWLRYFIRRDSQTPLSDGRARSFLFAVGHQLAACRPALFQPDQLKVVIKQRVGNLQVGGKVTAFQIEDLKASPFYQTAYNIEQNVDLIAGDLIGLSVTRLTAETQFIEVDTLQYLALLDPAQALLRVAPEEKIVILLDALDELRYQPTQESILQWLANCPELPQNVRIILTSRPEEMLTTFKQSQQPRVREIRIDLHSEEVQDDLRRFALNFCQRPVFQDILRNICIEPDTFVDMALMKASGNFQYLAAVFGGIEQAIRECDKGHLQLLVQLTELPESLQALYSFFLERIKERVTDELIEVKGLTASEKGYLPAWEGVYLPLLGVLAVAQEPLTFKQLHVLSQISAEERWVRRGLERLGQFLEQASGNYRLYHSTFPEFLTAKETQNTYPNCYLDPVIWHHKIVSFYQGQIPWEEVDWREVDNYGLRHVGNHLYALRQQKQYQRELYRLICRPLMYAEEERFDSHLSFREKVKLLLDVANGEKPPNWSQLFRGGLLLSKLDDSASNVDSRILELLVQLGLQERALNLAALLPEADKRSAAYLLISKALSVRQDSAKAREAIGQALQAALVIKKKGIKVENLCQIVKELVHLGVIEQAQIALEQALQVAQIITESDLDKHYLDREGKSVLLIQVVHALAVAGRTEQALSVAQTISAELDQAEALCWVAEVLLHTGQLEQALNLVEQVQQVTQTIYLESDIAKALRQIVHGLAVAGQTEQALQIAGAFQVIQVKAEMLCQIAEVLVQKREFEQAQRVAEQALFVAEVIEDGRDKTKALCQVEEVLVHFGQIEQARKVAGQALRVAQSIPEINRYEEVKRSVLMPVVHALAVAERTAQALQVAEAFQVEGDKAEALYQVAEVLAQKGLIEQAQRVTDQALSVAQAIEERYGKVEILCQIASLMARIELTYQAQQVAEQALQVAREIPVNDFPGSNYPWGRIRSLCLVAELKVTIGQAGQARQIAERALRAAQTFQISDLAKEIKMKALSKVVQGLAVSGRIEQAVQVVEFIPGTWDKAEILSQVVHDLTVIGQAEPALHLAKVIPYDIVIKADLIAQVVHELIASGQAEQAQQAANSLEDLWQKVDALCQVAEVFAQKGQVEQAQRTVEQLLRMAKTMRSEKRKSSALRQIADMMVTIRQTEQAQKAAVQALQAAQAIASKRDKIEALCQVAEVLARNGQFEQAQKASVQALQIAQTIAPKQYVAEELKQVVHALAMTERTEQALQTAEAFQVERDKAGALCQVVEVLAQKGMFELAQRVAEQALSVAQAIEDGSDKVETLCQVAEVFVRIGQFQQAQNAAGQILQVIQKSGYGQQVALRLVAAGFVEQGLQAAQTLSDFREAEVLGQIVHKLLAADRIEQALQVARSISDFYEEKKEALSQIVHKLLGAGRTEQALKVVQFMPNKWEITQVLCQGAEVLLHNGQVEQAQKVTMQALQVAQSLQKPKELVSKALELSRVAGLLGAIGQAEQAQGVAEQALQVASQTLQEGTWVKVAALSQMAEVLAQHEQQKHCQLALQAALISAQLLGQENVYIVLRHGALWLASLDDGRTLWDVFKALQEVESWWA